MFIQCPFCHKRIFRWFYAWHEAQHTRHRADGQMTEHVTAPPEKRFAGPLDGVPQAYRHSVCGVVTGMPEEIVRTYLVNPLAYNDGSFCCGCGTYVDSSQLDWVETGECVLDYMGKLRLEHLRSAMGMQLENRPAGIVVTPRFAKRIRVVLRELGVPQGCVFLSLPEAGATNYKLDVAPGIDERTQKRIDVSGIDFAVAKRDVGRVGGILLDYQESPRPGFSITRLYAPSGASGDSR